MKKGGKFTEIEIQVQIEKTQKLLAFLKKEAKFCGKLEQIDSYFIPAHRNFTKVRPIKEWLRLRSSSGKHTINYKNWHYDKAGRSHFADEYELEISDPAKMKGIFKALDMKPIVTVHKMRETWVYKDWEIAIDSIKNLGDFVEIEYKGKDKGKKPTEITQEMVNFLKKLDCGEIKRNYQGYPFQLLFPKEISHEKM
jgi:adenylate cyclase class 2